MNPTIDQIAVKLSDSLHSEPPEISWEAITPIEQVADGIDLTSIARYIANGLYALGMSDAEMIKWPASRLAEFGCIYAQADEADRAIELTFHHGCLRHTWPRTVFSPRHWGPVLTAADALADRRRVVRIEGYLDQLLLDFRAVKDLAAKAIEQAPTFSAAPNIEDAADEYVTIYAFPLKVLWLRIPNTLEALSRNYYYVPDHWRECKITIPYEVNSTTGELTLYRSLYDDWCRIETEIEADLWRVRNQPGYLATPAKLALLEHAISSGEVPADQAQQLRYTVPPTLLASPDGSVKSVDPPPSVVGLDGVVHQPEIPVVESTATAASITWKQTKYPVDHRVAEAFDSMIRKKGQPIGIQTILGCKVADAKIPDELRQIMAKADGNRGYRVTVFDLPPDAP